MEEEEVKEVEQEEEVKEEEEEEALVMDLLSAFGGLRVAKM